jgi:hypothetical protein
MPDVISGSTVNDESPTKPLVRLDTALAFLISRPSVGATERQNVHDMGDYVG